MSIETLPFTPALLMIGTALRLADVDHAEQAGGAVDRLVTALRAGKASIVSFDGVELRCTSTSRPELVHVTDGQSCSCEGGRHVWCVHRVLFRLLLAEQALINPVGLVRQIALACGAPESDAAAARPGLTGEQSWANDAAYQDYYRSVA